MFALRRASSMSAARGAAAAPRATRASRARGGVALAGAAAMYAAAPSDDAECKGGHSARIASYNVLSSHLCEPGYFVKCAPENLAPATRLARVRKALEEETAKGAVICLQEVARDWSGDLHAFFAARGYQRSTARELTRWGRRRGVVAASSRLAAA